MRCACRHASTLCRLVAAFCCLWPALSPAAVPLGNAWELPPVVLPDLQQQPRRLYDWHGQVILLNFWASWCAPCQAEIPHLLDWQRQYAARGLQVIGIALDEAAPVRNFVRTLGIDYPVLLASPAGHTGLLRTWGNPAGVLPYTVVIDRDGRIRFSQVGLLENETFNDYVRPLLGGQQLSAPGATAPPRPATVPVPAR